ncbi:MAG TPA: hypothetical protein VJM31_01650 [Vicinamibacterales bacterium]|nr:hypothetical protein [Vicinamibacterales bacterium]
MDLKRRVERGLGSAATLLGAAATSYAGVVGAAWLRYGHAAAPAADEMDPLLDIFMPAYDVAERHHIDVAAPAALTFGALMDMDLERSSVVRAIFKGRQLLLGADPHTKTAGRSLVEVTKALGWVVLADMPGHEIVMGAVTRPWEPNVVFRSLPSEEFASFNEPEYVKIVWTLRADAVSQYSSIARSETRAIATDAESRRKFRWYWARFSPGIVLIREISLRLVKKEAERRARM